jgi:hypothetical protein
MPRSVGSRNKKFTVVEKFEAEHASDLKKAEKEAEKKISQARPMPTDEQTLEFINTYEVKEPSHGKTGPDFFVGIPDEDRKKVLKAAAQASLLLGQSPTQISLQYGIPVNTIFQWQDTMITAGAVGRRDRLSDMLMIYIEQELKSLMAISIVTSDERWIRRQSAGELASFIAVKADRLMAMLAAFGRAEETKKRYMEQLRVIENNA